MAFINIYRYAVVFLLRRDYVNSVGDNTNIRELFPIPSEKEWIAILKEMYYTPDERKSKTSLTYDLIKLYNILNAHDFDYTRFSSRINVHF